MLITRIGLAQISKLVELISMLISLVFKPIKHITFIDLSFVGLVLKASHIIQEGFPKDLLKLHMMV